MRRLAPLMTIAIVLAGCGSASRPSPVTFSPYVDAALAPSQLASLVKNSEAHSVTFAFVLAAGGRCDPSWDKQRPVTDPTIAAAAARVTPVISFGGRDGPELAQVCSTAAALASQYERVIDRFHARRADFDIEPATAGGSGTIAKRSRALAELQAHERAAGRPIAVSLTLPADQHGLTPESLATVRSALAAGVDVQLVNVLAMDYGGPATPAQMAGYTIETASGAERQLRILLPRDPAARVWRMLEITTMIGHNDARSEVFTPTDAATIVRFAARRQVGALSFWSLARDRSCPSRSATGSAQDTCSGLEQHPFEFTRVFSGSSG